MSLPNSLLSYTQELDAYDAALRGQYGVRIWRGTESSARMFRFRLHHARTLQREKNREIHQKGDPLYGSCEYDPLTVVLRDDTEGEWWVYILKRPDISKYVEEITDSPYLEREDVKQLTGPEGDLP
jgi:hypothetical protein